MSIFLILFLLPHALARNCVYQDQHSTTPLNMFHEISSSSSCYPCLPQCRQCLSISDSTCNSGNCETGYFYDSVSSECVRCQNLCEQCSSQTECTKCLQGFYLDSNSGECRECENGASVCTFSSTLMCISGYYYDTQSYICKKCMSNCEVCQQSAICQQCSEGYLLASNGAQCMSCQVQYCSYCLSVSTCNACFQGYDLLSNTMCIKYQCSKSNCLQCQSSSSQCSLCDTDYYLYDGDCVYGASLMCEYAVNNTDYGSCLQCIDNAQLASGTNSYCIPSIPQSNIDRKYIIFYDIILCQVPYLSTTNPSTTSITVSEQIKSSYMIQITGLVIASSTEQIVIDLNFEHTLISQSQTPADIVCDDSTYSGYKVIRVDRFYRINTQSNNLQISFAANNANIAIKQLWLRFKLCETENCQKCASALACTKCQEPYYVQEYECVTECGDGYYTNNNLRTCVSVCENGYYENDLTLICEECPSTCSQCDSSTVCTKCKQNYYLEDEACKQTCTNPKLYPASSGMCQECLNPCEECSGSGLNCTSCKVGYLYMNECVSVCPQFYYSYVLVGNPLCLPCQYPCLNCQIQSTICTQCYSNMTLLQNTCIVECPQGYFMENSTCYDCINPCQQCYSLSNCSKCSYGILYMPQAKCLNQCPQYGYYHNFVDNSCDECEQGCLRCQSLQICLQCNTSQLLYLQDSKCVSVCQNGIPSNGTCQPCSYPCQLCSQSEGCHGCSEGYYLLTSQCVLRCPSGLYGNSTYSRCQACLNNCSICSSYDVCLQCDNNNTLINGMCSSECPSNTYQHNETCIQCSSNCKQCAGQAQMCTQCYDDSFLHNSICLQECPIGYLQLMNDTNNKIQCQVCSTQCFTCLTNVNYCTSCHTNYYLKQEQGLCIGLQQCNNMSGCYPNYHNMMCQQCQYPCLDCQSLLLCSLCADGTYLHNGKCVQECEDGYYEYSANNSCVLCQAQCSICANDHNCSQCSYGYYLYESGCLNVCPSMYYGSITTSQCQLCRYPCLQCNSILVCTSCQDSLILFNEQCLGECPQGTYYSDVDGSCVVCEQGCLTCTDDVTCYSCSPSYYHYSLNNTCLLNCPPTYYMQNISNICEKCSPPCVQCRNKYECVNCVLGYLFMNGYCYVSCPISSYPVSGNQSSYNTTLIYMYTDLQIDNRECIECPQLCAQCDNEWQCSQCVKDTVLLLNYSLNNGKGICIEECPLSMYNNGGQCYSCSSNCLSCVGTRTNCTSCNGSLLQNNKCVDECEQFFYYNITTDLCEQCGASCSQCINNTFCSQCFFSYLNKETGQCSQTCPLGTYKNSQQFVCDECEQGCINCISSLACVQCSDEYVLYNIKCIQKPCPTELYYYEKDNKCLQSCTGQGLLTDNDNRICYHKDDGCQSKLLRKGNLCLGQCSQNEYVNEQVECTVGQSSHEFIVQSIKGTNYILLYVLFVVDGLQVQQEWVNNFNVQAYRVGEQVTSSKRKGRQLLQIVRTQTDIEVSQEQKKKNNILIIKAKFQEQFEISRLQIVIQTKQPYRSMYHEGTPLQNYQYTIQVQNYFVDNTEQGTIAVAVIIISLVIVFNVLYLYYHGKPYLLSQMWEYVQLLYLVYYVNVQWPSTIGPFLQSFSISHLRWHIFTNPQQNVVFSPEKYYIQADDMSLFSNIGLNIIIIAITGFIILLCKLLSLLEWKLQQTCMSIYKYYKYILIIVAFFTYSNILLYACINIFYSPTPPLTNPITFSLVVSYIILIGTIVALIALFKMQWDNKNALDDGINPSKKRIIIALPLYRVFRRIVLIISLTIYSHNQAYMICLALVCSAFLLTLIYWYQPYANSFRYKCVIVQQAMLFLFLLFTFVYVLNPSLNADYCIFLTVWAFFLISTTFVYPVYCLYYYKKHGQSPQPTQNEQIQAQQIERQEQVEKKKTTIKIRKSVAKIQGNTDHEADESSQGNSKKKIDRDDKLNLMNHRMKVVKEFRNYDLDENEDNDLAEQEMQFSRVVEAQKKNRVSPIQSYHKQLKQ